MCTANLNATLQPCQHRWYTLLAPCRPGADLSNCRAKLRLQGWEMRTETCPWCSADAPDGFLDEALIDPATVKVFGGSPIRAYRRSSSSSSASTPYHQTRRRNSSVATTSTIASTSSQASRAEVGVVPPPPVQMRAEEDAEDEDLGQGERARMMNWRLGTYLSTAPEAPNPVHSHGKTRSGSPDKSTVLDTPRRTSVSAKVRGLGRAMLRL